MSNNSYLIVHKDHNIEVHGVNAGAEMATLSLAKYLKLAGKDVVVAGIINKGDTTKDGVEFWDIGENFNVSSALAKMSERGTYHLISGGRAQAILESREDKNCLSKTLISHDRQGNDTGISPSVLTRVADNVVAVSNAQSKIFEGKNVDFSKVKVVHNGVDYDIFYAGDTEKRDYNRLIFVGALIQDKGIHILIPVFNQLKQKYKDLTLDVYGSASLWEREPFINEKEVEASCPGIKFHGKVSQDVIAKAYATAGICTVPSIWFDPCPLTSFEAQTSGCPVAAFNVGGLADGILHGESGLVIDDISEVGLYNALDSMLSDEAKLKAMSKKALEHARASFSWEKTAGKIIGLAEAASAKSTSDDLSYSTDSQLEQRKIGVLTTWNQKCGLATYASYMFSNFDSDSFHVLAEELESEEDRTKEDEENVTRCWKRGVPQFQKILDVIEKEEIGLLHLNCQYRFFPQPFFADFIKQVQERGIKVVAVLHAAFTLDPQQQQLVKVVDKVIVHSDVNRLEVIANGALAKNVSVVRHGVEVKKELTSEQKDQLKDKLNVPKDKKLLVCFGFIQPHKGMEAVVEALAHLKSKSIDACAVVAGMPLKEDPGSTQYLVRLKEYAETNNVLENINFLNSFLSDDEVSDYLQIADIVIMNYHSQHYEASGACSLAIGAGAIVATSIAPVFHDFGDAVWHMTLGYPAGISAELLLSEENLINELHERRREFCNTNSWIATKQKLINVYNELGIEEVKRSSEGQTNFINESLDEMSGQKEKVNKVENFSNNQSKASGRGLKILFQSRENTFTQPGGDTILINQLKDNLSALGNQVVIDIEGKEDASNYDLVHLFNFALPDILRLQALKATSANTPFVVSSLAEDIPSFHNQSHVLAGALIDYVNTNQQSFSSPNLNAVERIERFQNDWTVRHASAILANGEGERKVLQRDYPEATNIKVVKLAHFPSKKASPDLFVNTYGIKDFVLCVGRLETRKNQLMLLKALENSDLTVVLAAGGFTYQPEYGEAVNNFRRNGKTLVLGRLEQEMLDSAYAAAKVHVLPSWYELPGLVSLEAAHNNCNIVASDTGTTKDYFGESAFYCDPSNEQSIANAVIAAYYSPFKEELVDVANQYSSWNKVAKDTLAVYREVLGIETLTEAQEASTTQVEADDIPVTSQTQSFSGYDFESGISNLQEEIEKGEIAARNKEFETAFSHFDKVLSSDPNSVRALRGKGAIYIAQSNFTQAIEVFEKAHAVNENDAKTISGLGMCAMQTGRAQEAFTYFTKSLDIEPNHIVTILQLVECSYFLNKFEELERVLRSYTTANPDDLEMQFCLAGACYKLNNYTEAKSICENVIAGKPEHKGASELLAELEKITVDTQIINTEDSLARSEKISLDNSGNETPIVTTVDSPKENLAPALGIVEMEVLGIEEAKRRKKYEDVFDRINKVRARDDISADVLEKVNLIEAEVKGLQGNIDFAVRVFNDILDANPKSSRALCGKGAIAAHDANWQEARNYFSKALTFDPNSDVAFAGLGLCSVCESKHEDAWDYYRRALAINPENMRAILGIVELGYSFGNYDRVESALTNYLEMHPADIDMLYSLAGCYYKQGRLDEASQQIEKILLFRPEHVNALELKEMIENGETAGVSSNSTTIVDQSR